MIKIKNTTQVLKRLEQLQEKLHFKDTTPIVLDLEKWLNSTDEHISFADYVMKLAKKFPDTQIIIDDMSIQSDMYLNTDLILDANRETIQLFVNHSEQGNEVEYVTEFIKLFNAWMDSMKGTESVEKVLSGMDDYFYLDFFRHYKQFTVEELVDRYKDQRFFEPQPLK